jgi:hypothetical protein
LRRSRSSCPSEATLGTLGSEEDRVRSAECSPLRDARFCTEPVLYSEILMYGLEKLRGLCT